MFSLNLSLSIQPQKTFFNKSWLASDAKDNNGDMLSDWCTDVQLDPHAMHCRVCRKSFSIANMGCQHATSFPMQMLKSINQNINNVKGQSVFKVVTAVSVSMPASASVTSVVLHCNYSRCCCCWSNVSVWQSISDC